MKKTNIKFGWAPSTLDGTEQVFEGDKTLPIPETYSFMEFLPPVWDQGQTSMCVTYSLSAHLDWNYNCDNQIDNHNDNGIKRDEIYAVRGHNGDGMTFKTALDYLKSTGVSSKHGKLKVEQFAMINSVDALKQALILNGPCVAGLMVYNCASPYFWQGKGKYECLGGHAISIVGYNRSGFIIRNSWGINWGFQGYTVLPYKEFNQILECWTIID